MKKIRIVVALTVAVTAGLFAPAGAHLADQVGPDYLGTLVYGESTFGDATALFGPPTDRRNVDGCVNTLIARWGPALRMFFDRDNGQTAIVAKVARYYFKAPNGSGWEFHTGKGLRIKDTVKKLKKLYPHADSFKGPGNTRRFLLRGKDQSAYLAATTKDGRVIRFINGFTC